MLKAQFKISSKGQSKFTLSPLENGYGHTLGNALRRVLLTSIPGAAITSVKIKGVSHQFSTLQGLKQDVVELILNLKKIDLSLTGSDSETIKLEVKGPKTVSAKDFKTPANVKIANPDLEIANLADSKSKLELTATVQTGTGYSPAEDQGKQPLGTIAVDALFSPVISVIYEVKPTRVGRRTDFDQLEITIDTNGTINPKDTLKQASQILVDHFNQIISPKTVKPSPSADSESNAQSVHLSLTVEELDLPTRIANSLRKAGYQTVADFQNASVDNLAQVKNIGDKSLKKIVSVLKKQGVEVAK